MHCGLSSTISCEWLDVDEHKRSLFFFSIKNYFFTLLIVPTFIALFTIKDIKTRVWVYEIRPSARFITTRGFQCLIMYSYIHSFICIHITRYQWCIQEPHVKTNLLLWQKNKRTEYCVQNFFITHITQSWFLLIYRQTRVGVNIIFTNKKFILMKQFMLFSFLCW